MKNTFFDIALRPRCIFILLINSTGYKIQSIRPHKSIKTFYYIIAPIPHSRAMSDKTPTLTSAKREKLIGFAN